MNLINLFVYVLFLALHGVSCGRGRIKYQNTHSNEPNGAQFASVPVVVVYDDMIRQNEGKPKTIMSKKSSANSNSENDTKTIENPNQDKIKTTAETMDTSNPKPKIPKSRQVLQTTKEYQIPVAVIYDTATETNIRRKLETFVDDVKYTNGERMKQRRRRLRTKEIKQNSTLDKNATGTSFITEEAKENRYGGNLQNTQKFIHRRIIRRRKPNEIQSENFNNTPFNTSYKSGVEMLTNAYKENDDSFKDGKHGLLSKIIDGQTNEYNSADQDEQIDFHFNIDDEKPNTQSGSDSFQKSDEIYPDVPKYNDIVSNLKEDNASIKEQKAKEPSLIKYDDSLIDERVSEVQSDYHNNKHKDPLVQKLRTYVPIHRVHNKNPEPQPIMTLVDKQNDNTTMKFNDNTSTGKTMVQKRTRTRATFVPIVNSENVVYAQSGTFHYSYEGGDATTRFENGALKQFKDNTGEAVDGGYAYTDKDGKSFSLTYTADENGFRPVGDHLPTPPPIPPAIARALLILATKPTPADEDYDVTEKLAVKIDRE